MACVRTTLEIDDDVIAVARDIAKRQRKGIGEVISAFARDAIGRGAATQALGFESDDALYDELRTLGIVPLPRTGVVVTNTQIDELRAGEGI